MNWALSSIGKGVNFITSQTTFERMFAVLISDYKELSTCRCSPTINSYSVRGETVTTNILLLNYRGHKGWTLGTRIFSVSYGKYSYIYKMNMLSIPSPIGNINVNFSLILHIPSMHWYNTGILWFILPLPLFQRSLGNVWQMRLATKVHDVRHFNYQKEHIEHMPAINFIDCISTRYWELLDVFNL